MDEIDKLHLMADLSESFCELNHGPETNKEDFPSVDYIIIPFGYKKDDTTEVVVREIGIPVCNECIKALYGEEWILLICKECSESHWVARQFSKHKYPPSPCVVWLNKCPCCGEKQ